MNIEPNPEHFAAISAARPRDINLSCLVGHSPGDMQLYNINDTGLSTVKKDWAERHAADGYPVEVIGLPVRTLADICREYAPPDIHFLKIDVEGAEEEVLRGADFTTYRPWIVLVEATIPNSRVENWEAWDPLLRKQITALCGLTVSTGSIWPRNGPRNWAKPFLRRRTCSITGYVPVSSKLPAWGRFTRSRRPWTDCERRR